jgi:PAS domain-containing protein
MAGEQQRHSSSNRELQDLTAKLENVNAELEATNERLRTALATGQVSEGRMRELAAIVESSDDAIVGKSLDGIIRSWNAVAQRRLRTPAIRTAPDAPHDLAGAPGRRRTPATHDGRVAASLPRSS